MIISHMLADDGNLATSGATYAVGEFVGETAIYTLATSGAATGWAAWGGLDVCLVAKGRGAEQSGPNGEVEYYARALRVSHNLSTGEISLPTTIPIFGLGFSLPEFPFGGEILYNPETYAELQLSCAGQ